MKKKFFAIFVTLVSVVMIASSVLAGGSPPGSGWWSGETVQNVSNTAANISITAYNADPAVAPITTSSSLVAAGGNKVFLPSDFANLPATFSGSGVVTADQDIRGIVNLTNRKVGAWGVDNGLASGVYQASGAGATSLRFPLVKNNYFTKTTTFYLQNAGDTAANITTKFYMGANVYTYTTSTPVQPYRMVAISPLDAVGPTGTIADGAAGSMVATSSQPLVGVVLEHLTTQNPATLLQATRGFASTEAAATFYAPVVKHSFGNRFTGISVQNTESTPIDVTVTYKSSTPACNGLTDSVTGLAANASKNFVHQAGGTNLPSGCLASATISATGKVVAIVNESFTSAFLSANPTRKQESTTYSAFAAPSATTKVVIPLYKENASGKATGLTVQNVGSATATNVVLTFVGPTGTYVTKPQTIAAGAGLTFFEVAKNANLWSGTALSYAALGGCASTCGANGLFGVTITSDQPIVAIANESTYPLATPPFPQDKNNYEGFNLP